MPDDLKKKALDTWRKKGFNDLYDFFCNFADIFGKKIEFQTLLLWAVEGEWPNLGNDVKIMGNMLARIRGTDGSGLFLLVHALLKYLETQPDNIKNALADELSAIKGRIEKYVMDEELTDYWYSKFVSLLARLENFLASLAFDAERGVTFADVLLE